MRLCWSIRPTHVPSARVLSRRSIRRAGRSSSPLDCGARRSSPGSARPAQPWPSSRMRSVSSANRPPRMLVVKLADLGDLLLSEPALRSLRDAYPTARIDLLVPPTSATLVPLLGHDL